MIAAVGDVLFYETNEAHSKPNENSNDGHVARCIDLCENLGLGLAADNLCSRDCTHDGTDVVTLHGEFKDPQTGEQVERKTILTLRSTSRYTYEEWHTRGDGELTLAMQIIFSKHQ